MHNSLVWEDMSGKIEHEFGVGQEKIMIRSFQPSGSSLAGLIKADRMLIYLRGP